jgi:hypothetical protein
MKIAPALLSFCLAARAFVAAEPATVHVLPQTEPTAAPQYFIGGAPAKVRLAIEAPLGVKVSVTGDLFQVSEMLAAPVSRDLSLAEGVSFAERTQAVVEAEFALPEVARRTRFIAKLRLHVAGEEGPRPAGEVVLFAYPRGHLDGLRKFLATRAGEGPPLLGVFGASPALRSFFEQEKIPFSDLGAELPASLGRKIIYVGEASTEKLAPRFSEEMRVIIFDRHSDALPGVYPSPRSPGFLIKVTLPLLDSLATNPHTQEMFARLLFQTMPDAPTPP